MIQPDVPLHSNWSWGELQFDPNRITSDSQHMGQTCVMRSNGVTGPAGSMAPPTASPMGAAEPFGGLPLALPPALPPAFFPFPQDLRGKYLPPPGGASLTGFKDSASGGGASGDPVLGFMQPPSNASAATAATFAMQQTLRQQQAMAMMTAMMTASAPFPALPGTIPGGFPRTGAEMCGMATTADVRGGWGGSQAAEVRGGQGGAPPPPPPAPAIPAAITPPSIEAQMQNLTAMRIQLAQMQQQNEALQAFMNLQHLQHLHQQHQQHQHLASTALPQGQHNLNFIMSAANAAIAPHHQHLMQQQNLQQQNLHGGLQLPPAAAAALAAAAAAPWTDPMSLMAAAAGAGGVNGGGGLKRQLSQALVEPPVPSLACKGGDNMCNPSALRGVAKAAPIGLLREDDTAAYVPRPRGMTEAGDLLRVASPEASGPLPHLLPSTLPPNLPPTLATAAAVAVAEGAAAAAARLALPSFYPPPPPTVPHPIAAAAAAAAAAMAAQTSMLSPPSSGIVPPLPRHLAAPTPSGMAGTQVLSPLGLLPSAGLLTSPHGAAPPAAYNKTSTHLVR